MLSFSDPAADPEAQARHLARLDFVVRATGVRDVQVMPASNDASFRSYWRAYLGEQTLIVMDAPPALEDLGPFLDVGQRLSSAGICVPAVHAQDRAQGFLLLDDFGNQTLLPLLDQDSVAQHYRSALAIAFAMAKKVDFSGLPHYDPTRLEAEMDLFPTWFLERHLCRTKTLSEQALFAATKALLVLNALEQPQVFVHRDFHSRNLMQKPDGALGVIDFQDAVCGPITYDLVSLLKDCYVEWPAQRVADWCRSQHQALVDAGIVDVSAERFERWFERMGIQRHLKVLGIFARLHHRDRKSGYLHDLPLVLRYTLAACARDPELNNFGRWLEELTRDRDLTVA